MTTTRPDGTPCGRQGGSYAEEERRECRNGGRFTDLSKCLTYSRRSVAKLQGAVTQLSCTCLHCSFSQQMYSNYVCTPTSKYFVVCMCRRLIHTGGGGGRVMAHDFVGKGRRCHVRRLQARTTPCLGKIKKPPPTAGSRKIHTKINL